MPTALEQLKTRLGEISDLRGAASVLHWDQETYMPAGGVGTRSAQISTLERIVHERFTSEATGELIEAASSKTGPESSDLDSRLLKVVKKDYDRATRIPPRLVKEISETSAQAMPAWAAARADNRFADFAPHLERIIGLSIEKAEAVGYDENIYDALLDEYEPDMRTAEVEAVFTDLLKELVPIVKAIATRAPIDRSCLYGEFDENRQWDFGLEVAAAFGYDLERGRQDRSAHPFTIHFSADDVRITTRLHKDFFPPAFFGTLHEAGHAMYEQGISPDLARTPLARGASLGMHESQSRLWENQVGRGRAFWEGYFDDLQEAFPSQFSGVTLGEFYGAINAVRPSLIRVESDEVTYNLHIMLRFELEQALLSRDLAVKDLPGAWNERMERYLGIRPETDARGVLQDIHWSMAAFGYFPTYSLGTLMSAQIFKKAKEELSGLENDLRSRQFSRLHDWLKLNIYRHGRTYPAQSLLERVTGSSLDSAPWLAYIRQKFGVLYGALP